METKARSTIPTEIMAELQEAADRAAKGIRDPEAMRKACEEMDRIREEIRREHGVLDIGVPSIRALRDGEEE
jgi:succinate dehydrogenase/fumarate reductase flavoprotein subunit